MNAGVSEYCQQKEICKLFEDSQLQEAALGPELLYILITNGGLSVFQNNDPLLSLFVTI
jgi:hypothetical protein